MAVFRENPKCHLCGEEIYGKYLDQSNRDPMNMFVGDTFQGWDYEGHNKTCKGKLQGYDKETYERIKKEALNLYPEFDKYSSMHSEMLGYIKGATAEHERLKDTRLYSQEVIDSYEEQLKQERNKTIDECINEFMNAPYAEFKISEIATTLSKLKH